MRPVPSRVATYVLILGSAAALLAVGLLVPVAFGRAEPPSVVPAAGPPATSGPVRDHDGRPPARYSDVSIVTGAVPPPGARLTASDVGVTPTMISLGIILIGLGGVSAFGIDTSSLDPKVQRSYWDFAIDRLNHSGGVDGRRLVPTYVTADILSTDSMRAACRALTEDRHVFAVANVLGVTGDPILCVTRDHATPYLGIDGADSSAYAVSEGRLVTIEPSVDRTLAIFLGRLRRLGTLAGHRVGVLHPTDVGGRRMFAGFFDGPLSAGDPLVVSGEVAAAEQRMQRAGVDTVLLLTNAVYGTVFAVQADQGRYTPTYVMSDLGFATAGNSYLANMPRSFFRHALAVTTTEIGRGRADLPESTLDAGCRHDFERATGKTAARDGADAAASLASCALVQLVTMGLNGAGPNPTRVAFSAALAQAGAFTLPGFGRAFLGPGHLDAASSVALAAADATCQCYGAIDGYAAA